MAGGRPAARVGTQEESAVINLPLALIFLYFAGANFSRWRRYRESILLANACGMLLLALMNFLFCVLDLYQGGSRR